MVPSNYLIILSSYVLFRNAGRLTYIPSISEILIYSDIDQTQNVGGNWKPNKHMSKVNFLEIFIDLIQYTVRDITIDFYYFSCLTQRTALVIGRGIITCQTSNKDKMLLYSLKDCIWLYTVPFLWNHQAHLPLKGYTSLHWRRDLNILSVQWLLLAALTID